VSRGCEKVSSLEGRREERLGACLVGDPLTMLYAVASASYKSFLTRANEVPPTRGPMSNEVLSAHGTIARLESSTGGTAVFAVKHYLRYAQLSIDRADPPQKEWRISVGNADSQTAQFADETEGSIAAVIAALGIGSLVALDWLQVAVRARGTEHIEYPCQKLEPISKATEERLLAEHPEIQILGLTSRMETLLRSARNRPDALAALHAAQRHPRALHALQDVVENGLVVASKYSKDAQVAALLTRLEELKLLEPDEAEPLPGPAPPPGSSAPDPVPE
jgi:hypothetical protein